MRKILLTQSQVSVVISTGAIAILTFLLFLSGFLLQQRTVKGLHTAIRPRLPSPPASILASQDEQSEITARLLKSRHFNPKNGRIALADMNRDVHIANANINWKRLAHIQLVTEHHQVCNAIMVLAELHRMKSPARKVLLFPRAWAEEKRAEKGQVSDPYLDSTRRLLRRAARSFHIELRPINPIDMDTSDAGPHEAYSIASAFALYGDFDRVLTVETPGMLLEAEPLDAILAFTESTPFTMLHDTHDHDGVHSEDLYLFEPSKDIFADLQSRIARSPEVLKNASSFSALFPEPLLLTSATEDSALIRAVSTLHEAGDDFNSTAYLSNVAYIRFWDPKLPGPQYDVPWSMKLAARPASKKADWTWTNLYGQFAQKRMDVCGLDLETWRP